MLEITGYPTVQPIQLIWRNGLDVVEDLFANPIFMNHMTYDPHIVVDGDEHEYIPIIIASDKTPVTQHTGGLEKHPIFVSLANIQSDVWMRATSHAWQCVGFMPIPKFSDVHSDYQTILSQWLFHKCMDIIFADAKVVAMVGKFMPNPSGHVQHCFTPLVAYTADLPEQQAIACVSKVASPITLATSQSFGDSYHHTPRTKEHTLSRVGTHHFSSRVRQMKQMTGREHRDLQRTLVPSIARVVPPQFIHAIRTLIDFIYKAQSPVYTDSSIDSMLLQSFAAFTQDIGALIQWTADLPFDRTSRQSCTFTEQIVDILNCEESMRRFQLYLFLRMHNTPLTNTIVTEEQEITETDPALAWIARIAPGDPNQRCFVGPRPVQNHFLKGILSSTATTAFHITVAPDRAKMSINEVQQLYICDRGCVKTWNKFRLQLHSVFHLWLIMPSQVIQAAPPSQTFPLGNYDAVIMQVQPIKIAKIGEAAMRRKIPILPRHITLPHYLADQPLIYVQYYEIVGHPHDDPAISMSTVARQYHYGSDGQRVRLGAAIPLTDVTHAVELIPVYGTGADCSVSAAMSMGVYEHFYLNNFSDKEIYHALRSDLH
ncbi:uncharacterized protein EDB93DRAFT_1242301 [Suillus bovinus]|uniref:uncharacterized protein n=1 Tax=Suillus bovinus TaxID=48563 RepID=UPI001B8860A9|nr:uncharacterized protein EDB93DRAFT_1242301 [Suillus bovinus]KAG2136941.1 hypothetical protein EDB93DRAFT_1242301 [Suillus bovinus]